MIEDIGAYLAVHSPFVMVLAWLVKTEWKSRFAKGLTLAIALAHAINALAYFLKLGDDFAIATYWSMYWVVPGSILQLKVCTKPQGQKRLLLHLPLALLVVPALGFVGILVALFISPPDFR